VRTLYQYCSLTSVRSQNDLNVPRKLIDVTNISISTENQISKSVYWHASCVAEKKKRKKTEDFVGTQPKKPPSPGWVAQTPRAGTSGSSASGWYSTLWADVAVIGVQPCSTMTAILPCVTLSYKN